VAVNVLVFLAMLADGAGLFTPDSAVHLTWGANYGPATKDGEWWRLAASMFLHFGLMHLALNMWALWGGGQLVERLYGNAAFALLYLFAGLCGSLASLYWNADKVVSAGASGAIFGVYGALGAYILRQPAEVPGRILKSLGASTLGFLAASLVLGVVVPGIDNAAHLGGLAGGVLAGLLLARPLVPQRTAGIGGLALAALLGSGLCAALVWIAPPAPYSYKAELAAEAALRTFALEERALAERASVVADALKRGKITRESAGEAMEGELAPRWRELEKKLAEVPPDARAPAGDRLSRVIEYARLRGEMYAEYGAALRTNDAVRAQRAHLLSLRVKSALAAINRPPEVEEVK